MQNTPRAIDHPEPRPVPKDAPVHTHPPLTEPEARRFLAVLHADETFRIDEAPGSPRFDR